MVPFCQLPLERLHLDLLGVVRVGVLLRVELRDGEHFDEELVLELDQIPFIETREGRGERRGKRREERRGEERGGERGGGRGETEGGGGEEKGRYVRPRERSVPHRMGSSRIPSIVDAYS